MVSHQEIGFSNRKGWKSSKPDSLRQAFGTRRGDVISLVGGGGKTTLMFALARELASSGGVITTTTTKFFEPLPCQTPLLLLEANEAEMMRLLLLNVDKYRHITLASKRLASGKLDGISPDLVARLAQIKQVSYIIVEADGAAHRSLKAPNPTEPVIPDNTSLVIAVVGIDAVGCRLTEENVFRPQIVSKLLGMPLGEVISSSAIAFLMTHHQGIIKGSPERARIVPFINKADLDEGLSKGRELADKILAMRHPQIERVVLGQAQSPEPVVEVISQKSIR
ncbi:MAG: selenium cofactor biosynthesis protein YqeC [Dehalococcoidia bacterium]